MAMDWIAQIADRLGLNLPSLNKRQIEALKVLLDQGRSARYAGYYDVALEHFRQAAKLAQQIRDDSLVIMIGIHQADTLINMQRLNDAQSLLENLKNEVAANPQQGHKAFILNASGVLAQKQERWTEARASYEEALALARGAHAIGAEGRAQGHLADTYSHEGNTSYAIYLLKEALPKLESAGDLELRSYFTGRLGEALISIGNKVEGQQYLGQALRMAERMQHRRYETQWREALAIQAMHEGLYEEARRHFMLLLADTDAQKPHPDYVRILCRTSKACLRLTEIEAAQDFAQQAVDLAARLEAQPELSLLVRVTQGVTMRAVGDYQQAIRLLESAAGSYITLDLTPADYSFVDLLRNLAASYVYTKNFAAAKTVYEQSLAHAQSQDAVTDIAGTHRDMGIMHLHKGLLPEAIKSWTTALTLYEQQGQHTRVARLYCDIASVRKQMGQGQRAMKNYERALMLLSSVEDLDTRGVILANAAIAYVDQGDVETAGAFLEEAISIAQQLHDRHAEATRRGNYGWFLLMSGQPQRSLEVLRYALRQSENLGLQLQTAVQTGNIGLTYDALNQRELAEEHHRRALAMLNEHDSTHWKAIISTNLGHTLLAMDQQQEAETLFESALNNQGGSPNAEVAIHAWYGQAKLALIRGEIEKATALINTAIKHTEQAGLRRLLLDGLMLRSEILMAGGETEWARQDQERATDMQRMMRRPSNGKRTATENTPAHEHSAPS